MLDPQDLTPAQINWLVAQIEGVKIWWQNDEECFMHHDQEEDGEREWRPATDFGQGAALIDREGITTSRMDGSTRPKDEQWGAWYPEDFDIESTCFGDSMLTAGLRSFIKRKRGKDLEVTAMPLAAQLHKES